MNQMQWDKSGGGGTGRVLTVEDDAAQMPLNMLTGTGGGGGPRSENAAPTIGDTGEDFSWVDAQPKKRSSANKRGLMLLLAVAVIGGGVLYGMRLVGGSETRDPAADEAAKKIESVLAELANKSSAGASNTNVNAMLQDSDKIISLFAADPTKKQIEVDQLQKNPFEIFVPRAETVPGAPAPAIVDAVDRVKEEKIRKIKLELETLKLQSLMSGNPPLAVVSGKILREGDPIGPFVIAAIKPTGVTLTAEGNTYTLAMTKPAMKGQQIAPH